MPQNFDIVTVFIAEHLSQQLDGKISIAGATIGNELVVNSIDGTGFFIGGLVRPKRKSLPIFIWLEGPNGTPKSRWGGEVMIDATDLTGEYETFLAVPVPPKARPSVEGEYRIYLGGDLEDRVLARRFNLKRVNGPVSEDFIEEYNGEAT